MSSSSQPVVVHPVLAFMEPQDKRTALLRLARLDAQLAGLRLRILAVADDVAQAEGARARAR